MLESAARLVNRHRMHNLILHPDCPAGPITAISGVIEPTESGCRTLFRATGDLDAIVIPPTSDPVRTDDLWRTSCFEIFWQEAGSTAYREFNMSPSTRWACYDFDDYRLNAHDASAKVAINTRREGDALVVEADISADLQTPADVALTTIIEDRQGNIQFWALKFASGKPDFHKPVCRNLRIEGLSA